MPVSSAEEGAAESVAAWQARASAMAARFATDARAVAWRPLTPEQTSWIASIMKQDGRSADRCAMVAERPSLTTGTPPVACDQNTP